ncbi:NADP transhydrogenase subunit alpha [Crassaminicella thermophila]|uniref:NADP transhydrogenase subunit alpha n=1 Tax=Crassaminicella thermophila TaxID=2599308 RepID=A0A5C0SET8_CRATE|nr:NAD/NADP octopine/nopaline dehydrogenase family protein [Crassaminicella thermophila]QEK11489.1 NADP transhydrogenase subunit alpha [Crassaminicella thermophila]
MNENKLTWAIIGGGNGGQAAAGHLGVLGFKVRLFDIIPETIMAINKQGGIHVEGAVNGFGKVELATIDIKQAVLGADIIMIVAPALAHKTIAKNLVPHLTDGQIIFIHPGATFGALEVRKVLDDEGCKADVVIAEALSLLYACRASKPGTASIKGIKNDLLVAAIPAAKTNEVVKKLNQAFPQMVSGKNVLETSLNNLNAVMHPAPSLLNTSMIESKHEWKYYWDGITKSVGAFVENLDKERIALGKALGLELPSVLELYKVLYNAEGETLSDAVKRNAAYAEIIGQKRIDTRYILEDIPMGLVPMVSLAKKLGVPCERMETVCKLGSFVLNKDLISNGRTLENLNLHETNLEEFLKYINTGSKAS